MAGSSSSVYDLVTRLCEVTLKSNDQYLKLRKKERETIVKDLRMSSYQILLKKSDISLRHESWKKSLSAITRLSCHSIDLDFALRSYKAEKLRSFIQKICDNNLADDPVFESALKFITEYADILWENGPPVPPTFRISYECYQYHIERIHTVPYQYREFPPQIFDSSTLISKLDLESSSRTTSGLQFFPRSGTFPFTAEPGSDNSLLSQFSYSNLNLKRSQSAVDTAFTIPELTEPRDLQFSSKSLSIFDIQLGDEGYATPSGKYSPDVSVCSGTDVEEDFYIWEEVCKDRDKPFHRTWETRGTPDVVKENPFASEAPSEVVHHMTICGWGINDACIYPQYVSSEVLIRSLKHLLLGVDSEIFTFCHETEGFIPKNGVCLKGYTPTTIASYLRDLLHCGALCRRLADFTSCRKNDKWDGFKDCLIRKALCKSLQCYLLSYHQAVMNLPSGPCLSSFRFGYNRYETQLKFLCNLLELDKPDGCVPFSFDLLEHLYEYLWKINNRSIVFIFAMLLKTCCNVYFKFIQKWIFEGVCNDVYDEFFIRIRPELEGSFSRRYWSKGFLLCAGSVPQFLRGLETQVFECGRTLNLLKLCNPKDPLCRVLEGGYPAITCCLTSSQLEHHESICHEYFERARLACGKSMSTRDLWETNHEQERLFLENVQQVQEKRMKDIMTKRQERMLKISAEKHARLVELKKDMEQAIARKAEERQKQLEMDAKILEEGMKLDEEEARFREEERRRIEQYYEALSADADKRRMAAEQKIKLLRGSSRYETSTTNANADELDSNSNVEVINTSNNEQVSNITYTSTTLNRNSAPEDVNSNIVPDNINVSRTSEQNDVNRNSTSDADVDNANVIVQNFEREESKVRLESDLERNRRKVLAHEYGIITYPEQTKPSYLNISKVSRTTQDSPDLNENQNLRNIESEDRNVCNLTFIKESLSETSSESGMTQVKESDEFYPALSDNECEEMAVDSVTTDTGFTPDNENSDVINLFEQSCGDLGNSSEEEFSSCVSIPELIRKKPGPLGTQLTNMRSFSFIKFYEENCGKLFSVESTTTDVANSVIKRSFPSFSEIEELRNFDVFFASTALCRSVLIPLEIQAKLVNEQILKHFLIHENLLSHLNSLRSYFFLLDGEFGRNMTRELFDSTYKVATPAALLNFTALNSILARALASSISGAGENGSRLSFSVLSVPNEFRHSSVDILGCLSLQYKTSWPLNIIITDEALEKYNQVFGFILKLRRISWILEEDFQWLKQFSKVSNTMQYHKIQLWRHEMTHFIIATQNYVTSMIQGCWSEFQKNLCNAVSLDDLYRTHVKYIKQVIYRCLLRRQASSIQEVLFDICKLILKFHGILRGCTWEKKRSNSKLRHSRFELLTKMYDSFKKLSLFFYRCVNKLAVTGYEAHLNELVQILNMNGYYSAEINSSATE